jgi:DNA-binding IscR family transcriptional regulator
VLPFEHRWNGVECILGQAYCTDQAACPIHDEWVGIRKSMCDLLERTTLADIAERAVRTPLVFDDNPAGVKQP